MFAKFTADTVYIVPWK